MNTDIERLLAEAADDSDQPMHSTVDELVVKARRSARHRRIATAATAALTTAVVIGGVATWSMTQTESDGPAGQDRAGQTITINSTTGAVVDGETGRTIAPPPPVNPLSDAEILKRCEPYSRMHVSFLRGRPANRYDKAGPIDARWKLVVKSGDKSHFNALFLAPDRSIVTSCTMFIHSQPISTGRDSTTEVTPHSTNNLPEAVEKGSWVPVPGVAHVLLDVNYSSTPVQALVGSDGFYSLGYAHSIDTWGSIKRIRAYDATGKKVWERVLTPPS